MKHFTLLIVALTMFAWQGYSQTLNQNAAWPNAAWTLTGTYDVTMLLADPTASANFSYDDDGAGSGSTDILVATSPVIDLTAASGAGETWLNVDYDHNNNLSYTFDLEWYDADLAAWNVWEAIVDNSGLFDSWCAALPGAGTTSTTLDISGFTPTQLSGFQYRINYDATSGWGYGFCMSAPTIVSAMPPACLDPTALTATAITASGADLGWMDNAGAGQFNVEYDLAGFILGTGTQILGTTNNPESVTGLLPQTDYEFYIQVDCGGGDLSTWVGPFAFTTLCAVVTPDYLQPFNAFLPDACWDEATAGDIAAGPSSFGTGNWGASTTFGNDVKMNLYSNFVSDWALSPNFDLSVGGYEAVLDVAVTDWNGSTPDVMGSDDQITLAYTEDGITWNTLMTWTAADALANTLTTFTALIPSTGTNVQFGILGSDGTVDDAEDYDFHFDNFQVRTPPACLDASGLMAAAITATGADISWTDNAGAGLFNVEYGVAGFVLGAGTQIMGTTNTTESITGLLPSTTYEFYVQTDCGSNTSTWVGPISFTTPCAAVIAPWTDPLTTTVTPTCWSQSTTTGGPWTFTGNPGYDVAGMLDHTSGVANNYAWIDFSSTDVGVILTTPEIDVTALTVPELRFWEVSHYTGALAVYNLIHVEAWDGTAWQLVASYQGETGPTWVEHTAILTPYIYNTNFVQLRFRAESGNESNDFNNDLLIDDISVVEAPTCPQPINLTLVSSDLTSGDFAWTSQGSETEWELEYGAPGFTPGMGTGVTAGPTPDGSITGLPSNMFYDVYVRAVCTPGDTSFYTGAITFNTYDQPLYMDQSTECPTAGFIDISSTGTGTALTDDGEIGVTMPFPFLYQGTLISDLTIGNNGGIALGTLTAQVGLGGIVGAGTADGLYPFWDDLDSEDGDIYYETVGTPGNQVFIVQYEQRPHFSGVVGQTITFQVQIEEATNEIYFVYNDVEFGGSQAALDFAASAGIGVAGPNQDLETSSNDVTYLTNNSCARYYYTDCPSPLNYAVTYTTVDEAGITWNAGLAGETDWTIIYGPAGFDPLASGTTVTSSTPALIIPGLDDITEYDVYIYADCNPGVLQSLGATGSFTTLPNCADITGLGALTATDSIFTSWTFVENPGFPSTGFDIEYGYTGYTQGMGTIVNADNNYTDTTMDASLLSGALYDVYVQSICGTDSSNFVGPFTVTMPLDNDSTCLSETLVVDGTLYTFDKTGATAQLNEVNITPPVTGYNTNDGWGQTGLNFSTWFTFEAPASGQVRINGTDEGFAGQMAVYDVTDCADFATFTLMGANDNANTGGFSSAPNFTVCGLTPGNTYYLMHDANSTTSTTSNGGIYSVALTEVVVEGGTTNGIVDICVGDTVDLFTAIAGYDMGGTWYQETPTLGLNGSEFVSAGLAYQVFNFQYEVVDGCAMDSVVQQVEIYGPSSAGTDGTITACQNEPVDLLMGLGGNVDLGGTWYDPTNTVTPSAIVTSSIPGSFNYDYITGNGVCADDTANVIVSVDPLCDYLSIEEVAFENMSIFPNPTNGSVFLTNEGSNEVFNFELTDVNGKVIVAQDAAINGTETTEVSLTNLESGFYLIRVFNDNADKTFRIIKE